MNNRNLQRSADDAKDIIDSLVAEIEDLENIVEDLRSDNDTLKERIEFLEEELSNSLNKE